MVRKKADAEKLVTVQTSVPVVIWRANRPLNEQQHEELVQKLKKEETRSGIEILLVPYSVDVEIISEIVENQPEEEPVKEPVAADPSSEE